MLTEAVLIEQNRRLRERVDELEETVRQLRSAGEAPLPDWMPHFTRQEEVIFRALLTGRIISRERLHSMIYGDAIDPDPRIIDVFMVRVRKKALSVGLTVKNQWGQGWYLNEASMGLIARLAAEAEGVAA